jgi:hypothetical protein
MHDSNSTAAAATATQPLNSAAQAPTRACYIMMSIWDGMAIEASYCYGALRLLQLRLPRLLHPSVPALPFASSALPAAVQPADNRACVLPLRLRARDAYRTSLQAAHAIAVYNQTTGGCQPTEHAHRHVSPNRCDFRMLTLRFVA